MASMSKLGTPSSLGSTVVEMTEKGSIVAQISSDPNAEGGGDERDKPLSRIGQVRLSSGPPPSARRFRDLTMRAETGGAVLAQGKSIELLGRLWHHARVAARQPCGHPISLARFGDQPYEVGFRDDTD